MKVHGKRLRSNLGKTNEFLPKICHSFYSFHHLTLIWTEFGGEIELDVHFVSVRFHEARLPCQFTKLSPSFQLLCFRKEASIYKALGSVFTSRVSLLHLLIP